MIEVSEATEDDQERLIEIYSSPELHQTVEDSTWFVKCYFDYHHIEVARDAGGIRGACFWRIMGEKVWGSAWIDNLWVEEEFRRKGIGGLLLVKSIQDINTFFLGDGIKARRVVLTVPETSGNARRLYEKVGFEFVSDLRDIYEKGNNELLYVLDLEKDL